MAGLIAIERSGMRALPRLLHILGGPIRHRSLGSLIGGGHWPMPKELRQTFEQLGLVFLKFGQVLSMRRDLLPDADAKELESLHDQLPAMGVAVLRSRIKMELSAPVARLLSSFANPTYSPIGP